MATDHEEESDARLAAARSVLDEVVGQGGDVIVRDGAALLVRRADVMVRLRDADARSVAERELQLAARLARDGVPVVPTVGGDRLWRVGGYVASCWRWVTATRSVGPEDIGALAGLLRTRTATGGPDGLPAFDPLGHILDVVGECGAEPEACFVRDRVEDLRPRYTGAADDDPLGQAVVHGDLHGENVVVGPEGPLLLDLEMGGWGPASYDTAPVVVAQRRYGASAAEVQRFVSAAGADPRGWSGFEVLVSVYELWVTAWAVSVAHRRPDWAAEAALRVATLRDGSDEPWRLS